jgi:hypothetical protein
MISTRSVGLLIDTVVCLTLAKWETVSGRFGGYLSFDFPWYYSVASSSSLGRNGIANREDSAENGANLLRQASLLRTAIFLQRTGTLCGAFALQ